jgi:hypothetical protein
MDGRVGRLIKKTAFVLTTVLLALLVGVLVFEVLSIAVLTFKDRHYVGARELLRREEGAFIGDVTRSGPNCQYIDTMFPHPYLAFVHHANPPCGMWYVNNIGLFGPDFPAEKRTDRFVILVTGGSVAAQFAQNYPTGPKYLEEVLNASYSSPTEKPFLVLNGGDGAWKQPQQAILFLLYSDVVDAVVTLDGYNEHYYTMGSVPLRFEYPAANFLMVNPLVENRYDVVAGRWLLGRLVGYLSRNRLLSRSHGAVMIARVLRSAIERLSASPGERKTTLQSIFAIPPEWDQQKRSEWSLGQYRKYIRSIDALAADRKVFAAHFIQPCPAIGKRLTPEERAVVGDLNYAADYAHMTDSLLGLRRDGVKIFSLLELFHDVDHTIYEDHAHMKKDAHGESEGYRRMAIEIARTIAAEWGLKQRARN